ncbi:FMN-dependent NADH-azoreductase [Chitinophaga sp.]|uniref:FMN-dependent NADH-azoreductase n=1 Tax=Chitinophaga sp. TaxID=1869181 RepID=UPI002B63FDFA|nr:NAD(P)H-dependent oxidoreductase [Chitinophaga sp.]HWV65142.1 NAD(P)H-dependent oxidoreductase [Chitinophaga sp.]
MKKILEIISSARGAASNSTQLTHTIIEKLKAQYPGSTVTQRDLVQKKYPHLEESHLSAFFAPPENENEAYKTAIQHSDEAIHELEAADIVVIGVPVYNFSIPSALKAWIDHVVRAGRTFSYGNGHPEGLLKNKKVYLAVASGGVYSDGPMKSMDYAEPYLKWILGFIGLNDVTTFRVEGLSVPDLKETALQKGLESVAV